jgi:hypothetical protein
MTNVTSSPAATAYRTSLNGSAASPALLMVPPNCPVNGLNPYGPPVPVKLLASLDAYSVAV